MCHSCYTRHNCRCARYVARYGLHRLLGTAGYRDSTAGYRDSTAGYRAYRGVQVTGDCWLQCYRVRGLQVK